MTTLNDPQLQVNPEDYALYKFFGTIPEEDYTLSVFGLRDKTILEACVYKGLLLRSRDAALACSQFVEGPCREEEVEK